MRRHFDVTAPAVHQMVIVREKAGLIKREQSAPQSIPIKLSPADLLIVR